MRLILDDTVPRNHFGLVTGRFAGYCYLKADTIEITDAEWDEIFAGYLHEYVTDVGKVGGATVYSWNCDQSFAWYLHKLIELKRAMK
jgi:hypothetical protein